MVFEQMVAAGHAEEETRHGEAPEAGPGNETSSGTRPATHVVSGATASSLQHIIPSNVHDMDPEYAPAPPPFPVPVVLGIYHMAYARLQAFAVPCFVKATIAAAADQ